MVLSSALEADRWMTLLSLLMLPALMIVGALQPLWLRYLIDAALARHMEAALAAAAAMGVSFGLTWYLGGVEARVRRTVMERVGFALNQKLIELTVGIPGLEHMERPEYLDRIELLREARWQLSAAWNGLSLVINASITALVMLVLLASLDPRLLLLALVAPIGLVVERRVQARQRLAEDAAAESLRLRDAWRRLAADPAGGRELRVFGLAQEIRRRHAAAGETAVRERVAGQRYATVANLAQTLVSTGSLIAAIVLLTVRAIGGGLTVGEVMMGLTLVSRVVQQVSQSLRASGWLLAALRATTRLSWLMDYARDNASPAMAASAPDSLRQGIRFRGVSFRYPGLEHDALSHVDLDLPAGSTVALVGENGSGKTTLIKLLSRMYDPTDGRIEVDGQDLRSIPHEVWRERLSGAFQDYLRPEVRAGEAVGLGDLPRIGDESAIRAGLARGGAAELPEQLAAGLETQLGRRWDGGVELSGGQWQKLALGRGLIRDRPLLLLLDEPTAALDAETEHRLFEDFAHAAREGSSRGAITLLVSHRFSTVRMAELIVVMDRGRVLELGTHEELMRASGLYAELFSIQERAYR
jgi:ATP-binding cassette subfamily B protein